MARTGLPYALDFHARYAAATTVQTVVPFFGVPGPPLAVPPFGILRLDPAALVALPPVAIPFQAPATVTLAIPNMVAIAGLPLHTQGVILNGTQLSDARLTNLVVDRLQR